MTAATDPKDGRRGSVESRAVWAEGGSGTTARRQVERRPSMALETSQATAGASCQMEIRKRWRRWLHRM